MIAKHARLLAGLLALLFASVAFVHAESGVLVPLDAIDDPLNPVLGDATQGKLPPSQLTLGARTSIQEKQNSIIEIIPSYPLFVEGTVCSRWDVYSIDKKTSQLICNGPESCCAHMRLPSSTDQWDAPLYLTDGQLGATKHNLVSHQLVVVDGLAAHYSSWTKIDAIFDPQITSLKKQESDQQKIQLVSTTQASPSTVDAKTSFELKPESTTQPNQPKVFITDVKPEDVEWKNTEQITITQSNEVLEQQLANNGVVVDTLVAVEQMDEVLHDKEYDGLVRIPLSQIPDHVLFCPDDNLESCSPLHSCTASTDSCYQLVNGEAIIHIPHYSTVILGFDNDSALITISSPDNVSALTSGEDIILNLSSNITVTANYSLDGASVINLGNGTLFTPFLQGTLDQNTLANGQHTLTLQFTDQLSRTSQLTHTFVIADTQAPTLSVNRSNNSVVTMSGSTLALEVQSSEYGNISYRVNGGSFSTPLSLGSDRKEALALSVITGTNIVDFIITDAQGNSDALTYTFTVTQAGTCSDGTQNQDETGVDCGGSCPACIALSIQTDQSSYTLGNTILLSVFSRSNSSVHVSVNHSGVSVWQHTFIPAFAGAPISDSRIVTNVTSAGSYTIDAFMTYLNTTDYTSTTFSVTTPPSPTLTASISVNSSSIVEGDDVYVQLSASGETGKKSVSWDFNEDGVTDSTLHNLTRTFSDNGTIIINATVSDDDDTIHVTKSITVLNEFELYVDVKDNKTGNFVPNATITIDGIRYTTGEGTRIVKLTEGTYDVSITHDNYSSDNQDMELDASKYLYVNLTPFDRDSPVLSLQSPIANTSETNSTVEFVFTVDDESRTTCTLFTRQNSVLWKERQSTTIQRPQGQYVMSIDGFSNGEHEWQVECVDARSNRVTSATENFVIVEEKPEQSESSQQQEAEADKAMVSLEEAITALDELSSKEKETAQWLGVDTSLERALTEVKRIKRDIGSLVWRRLNETTRPEEEAKLAHRLESLYTKTPISVVVDDKNEYVLSPNIEELEFITSYYANQTNFKYSKSQKARLQEQIHEIQSLITITTTAMEVTFTMLDGSEQTQTVIKKSISHDIDDTSLFVFYEVIPKEFAQAVNETTMLFDFTVIDPDPIIQIDVDKLSEYTYILPKKHDLEDTQTILSVLLPKELTAPSGSFITGFAVVDTVTAGIRETVDIRLIIEFLIIVILLIIYFIYSAGSIQKFRRWFLHKSVREVHNLLDHVHSAIADREYEEAKKHYTTVLAHFKVMEHKHKEKVKHHISHATHAVNVLYMHTLLNEADTVASENDHHKMKHVYKKVQSLYKVLPKEHKKKVSDKCLMLHKALANKKAQAPAV